MAIGRHMLYMQVCVSAMACRKIAGAEICFLVEAFPCERGRVGAGRHVHAGAPATCEVLSSSTGTGGCRVRRVAPKVARVRARHVKRHWQVDERGVQCKKSERRSCASVTRLPSSHRR